MTSATDLIINEIANVLGILPSEVKSRFTEDQLKELFDLSLCEPTDEVGGPLGAISELPCDEAPPQLLPEVDTADLEKMIQELEKTPAVNPVKKCIDSVETVSAKLDKDRELYVKYSNLYDKLIEYQDNFEPVAIYFEERAKEMARILSDFGAILEKQKDLQTKLDKARSDLNSLRNSVSATSNPKTVNSQIDSLNTTISSLENQLTAQKNLLDGKEKSIPIFSNSYYPALMQNIDSKAGDEAIASALSNLYSNYVDLAQLNQVQSYISTYSQCVQVIETSTAPTSINQAITTSFFKFSVNLPQLFTFKLESQDLDPKTKEYTTKKTDFPIKGNPLLEKHTFFDDSSFFRSGELTLDKDSQVSGKIYTDYYNLLADPINNFFTLDDRGLTTEVALIDPKVKGTDSEKKREGTKEFFVKDLNKLQQFYQNFEESLESKKNQKRAQVIEPAKQGIQAVFRNLAQRDVQLLLAIGKVNKFTENSSDSLKSIVTDIKKQNETILKASTDLSSEIARIKQKLIDLKPSPDKVREMLKKQSPECFPTPAETSNCVSVMDKMGKDPLYLKSITEGVDPTLPNSTQFCYWLQFSIVANSMGLIPMPNLPDITQLRYWPVGLTIPSPAGLIKIPLPVIWVPLAVFPTPMGTLVIFLTINGIFISPIIFLVSSSGFKQHIFTVRGPSPKFGFSNQEEYLKPGVKKPVAFLANQEKIQRLAKEAALGKDFNLSKAQKVEVEKQRNILRLTEESAKKTGNKNRLLKVAREKKNLAEATSNLGQHEKMQKILDKTESAKDAVELAKRAIHQRINDLGKPVMAKSNSIKTKITSRQENLLKDLQGALVAGDEELAKAIREQAKVDGIEMSEKISAIKSDMRAYFNRLKFPKISIPKDAGKIEPKPNGIIEFLQEVLEFSSVYRSNFVSLDSLKVRNMLMMQLAKSKRTIKKKIEKGVSNGETLGVEKDFPKIKKYLLDINTELVNELMGKGGDKASVDAQAKKVTAAREKVKKEKDPKKKKNLQKELEKEQVLFSEKFDKARVKEALGLTAAALTTLSQLKVEFNPFSPCCAKKSFELDLSSLSPAVPVIESVKGLLNSHTNKLTPQQFKSLIGGKSTISPRELTSAYLGVIKNAVPSQLAIPVPALNLLTYSAAFSGTLISLFEPRVPNPAAAPFSLPKRITIDLNLLKPILLEALMAFLDNCLPNVTSPQKNQSTINQQVSPNSLQTSATLDPSLKIIECLPDDSQRSAISNGGYSPITKEKVPTSSTFSSGTVISNSAKDILPSFSTMATDFLSINSSDLLAVLKNFVDLGFDTAEKVLDQFYKILNGILSVKDVRLNALEAPQYAVPSIIPPAPPYLPTFTALTIAKSKINNSSNLQLIDTDALASKLSLVEKTLGPISKSPLPTITALIAGVADHAVSGVTLPPIPKVDAATFSLSMVDSTKPSYATIRNLHPVVSQDDIPSWERLSPANPLFLLFVDQFLVSGADKVGLFRNYL